MESRNIRELSGLEVDFIIGDHEIAIEAKGVEQIMGSHLRGLSTFIEEYSPKQAIIISLDPRPRKVVAISIMPWEYFLEQLWQGKLIHS